MKTNHQKIFISTGGTGGHIFPAISLADDLKEKYNIEIITDNRGLKYLSNYKKIKIKIINSSTIFNKNIIKFFIGFIKVIISFFISILFIIKNRPNLIIGMGGYSSFPFCVAGFCLRIPVLIYENNLVIGKANKYLLPLVKKIVVSTNNVEGIIPKYKNKIFSSGYLIRRQILNLKKEEKEKSNLEDFSILIIGGSQSAKVFGELLPHVMVNCFQNGIKIKIYQQCLEYQIEKIKKIYEKSKIQFELFSFSEDMTKFYKKADLAITRSGASTMAELTNLCIPSIAVPLPSSADNHQQKNAKYFEERGCCYILNETSLSDKLLKILLNLKENKKKLFIMKKKMKEYSDINTVTKIEKLIEKILNDKN